MVRQRLLLYDLVSSGKRVGAYHLLNFSGGRVPVAGRDRLAARRSTARYETRRRRHQPQYVASPLRRKNINLFIVKPAWVSGHLNRGRPCGKRKGLDYTSAGYDLEAPIRHPAVLRQASSVSRRAGSPNDTADTFCVNPAATAADYHVVAFVYVFCAFSSVANA